MSTQVLYICSYLIPSVRNQYNRIWFSRAGLNEKRGTVTSLHANGSDITVLSPVIPDGRTLGYQSAKEFRDGECDMDVIVPPAFNVFGLVPINYAFTVLSTVVYAILLYRRYNYTVTLSYNFRPENALPGLVGKYIVGTAYILQYEDGLFVHQSSLRRISAKLTKRLCNPSLDGAVCTNRPLADTLATTNIAIVRGYPSIGMPETLPNPLYRDKDNTVIMFAGSFDQIRGVDWFIDIIPRIEGDDVTFWISGTGRDDQKARVSERVQMIDDNRVTNFGTLDWAEYRRRIVSADILVNLQDPEAAITEYTFPSKLLDFMSAGQVIVSTDMSDLESEFPNELVVDGKTVESFTKTLEQTITAYRNDEIDTGTCAQLWVESNCTKEYAGNQYQHVFRNA